MKTKTWVLDFKKSYWPEIEPVKRDDSHWSWREENVIRGERPVSKVRAAKIKKIQSLQERD